AITESQLQPGGLVKAEKKDDNDCHFFQVYSYVNAFTPKDASGENDLVTGVSPISSANSPTTSDDASSDISTEINMNSFELYYSDGSSTQTTSFAPQYECTLTDPSLQYYRIEAPTQIGSHVNRQVSSYESPWAGIKTCELIGPCVKHIEDYNSQSSTVTMETTAGWTYDGSLVSSDSTLLSTIQVKYFWRVRQNPNDDTSGCQSSDNSAISDYNDYPISFTTPAFDLVELTLLKPSPPSSGI
ncbi:MAG: hypothetical protein AAFO69_14825, partial [Bacteroidota bacterium]